MNHLESIGEPLARLGFVSSFVQGFASFYALGLRPARVIVEHRGSYVVACEDGERHAELSGKFRHSVATRHELPAVGDWVAIRASEGELAIIHGLVPRRTAFVRGIAGGTTEAQVVAANVDVVFLVCAFGDERDLNLRRLERYLSVALASGAEPVIVLTKSDREADIDARSAEVRRIARAVPIHTVSGLTGDGVDALRAYFDGHRTVALLGTSGVGKSTLVNRWIGEEVQRTGGLDVEGRGKHTTTHRQLILVPGGGLVLDTPGMRELRLWDDGDAREGLHDTFADIAGLAASCRFRDCTHHREPGCAVRQALEEGHLDEERWESFVKLERELSSLAARQDVRLASERKKAVKVIARAIRARPNKRE